MQRLGTTTTESELDTFAAATSDLVGVALRSIAPEGVSAPQFRMLLALHQRGPTSSAQVARTLDLAPSSVTRLADRLVADRLVQRGGVPEHRGVVALSLTPTGEQLVARVLDRRRAELAGVLDCLAPDLRSAAAEALRTIHDLLGQNQSIGTIV